MKLTLKHFRCYAGEQTFTFEQPLVFLVGISGMGKTTVLDALHFVLYGKGKNLTSLYTTEPYSVELTSGALRIKRTKTSLVFQDADGFVSDIVAQAKIQRLFGRQLFLYSQSGASHFLELAPRDQLETLEEILFGDEVDIRELKGKFSAEKRALDSAAKELAAKQSMTMEFLRKIGPITEVQPASTENAQAARRRLCFLKLRIWLRRSYVQRRAQLQTEIEQLAKTSLSVPYSTEQLERHVEAMRQLEKLQWQNYLGYTPEECTEEIECYRGDEELLRGAEALTCPTCSARLCVEENQLVAAAADDPERVAAVLEELGVASVAEALADVRRQIKTYEKYREQRKQIDEQKQDVLPLSKTKEEIVQMLRANTASQLQQKESYRGRLEEAARASRVDEWGAHEQEAAEIEQQLQNSDLFAMRAKETAIKQEYDAQLADLTTRARLCGARQAGLARASVILAETEQQYLADMIERIAAELNQFIAEVFSLSAPQVEMGIEATAGGARKLKIAFRRDDTAYTYEMFSGGEKARINLCFLLVLARVQNYKVLLLDEFARFLDRDTATTVLQTLRRNFSGQIIAAEHERIGGAEQAQEINLSA